MTGWRHTLIAVAGCRSTLPDAAHVAPDATASVKAPSELVGYGPGTGRCSL